MNLPPPAEAVVFFDGVCGLCNGFVDFLIARDTGKKLRYAMLQGTSFVAVRQSHPELQGVDSVVVVETSGKVHIFSDASLAALSHLPGLWRYARLLRGIPRVLRDFVYRIIARNRYGWFGKRDTCRLPSPQERDLFLD